MKLRCLEVTYRRGRPLAAYYHLAREDDDASARTQEFEGDLVVDFAADGRVLGVEILSPEHVDLTLFNRALVRLGEHPVSAEELAPLSAA